MQKPVILVVDDEQDVLTIMQDFLEMSGYSVITADNGPDACTLAKSKTPDLIILDITMPDMDGGQVAQQLEDTPETKDIPIIFLTGLLSKDDEKHTGNKVGGKIMFAKPCDFNELVKQIENLLPASTT